jgi:hypothetical protein
MESGRWFPIFVGSTKQTDMLRSISWLQFTAFLFISLLVYYGYFACVLYRSGVLRTTLSAILGGRLTAWLGLAAAAAQVTEQEKGSTGGQGEVVKRLETDKNMPGIDKAAAEPDNTTTGKDKEAKMAESNTKETANHTTEADAKKKAALQTREMLIMHLKEVVDYAVANGLSWEEIMRRMELVLSGGHGLRGTEYEAGINSFIEQSCRASFALVLGKEDLDLLWGGGQQEQTPSEQQKKH